MPADALTVPPVPYLHLAGFEGRSEGFVVAVGDGTDQGVLLGGTFEPSEH
jgi:hypothetical protein